MLLAQELLPNLVGAAFLISLLCPTSLAGAKYKLKALTFPFTAGKLSLQWTVRESL